jgi:ligand-binding sensor domain-containing protein
MTDLEERLRLALQRQAADVRPHGHAEADFARRLEDRSKRPWRWQPPLLALAAACAVVVIVLGALVTSSLVDHHTQPADLPTPPPGLVQLSVPLGTAPSLLAAGQGAVWLVDADGRVRKLDLLTHALTTVGTLPHWGTGSVAAGLGGLWAADAGDRSVVRIDARTGRLRRVQVARTGVVSVGESRVWAQVGPDRLASLDVDTGTVDRTIGLPGPPTALIEHHGVLWVASGATLYRLSPADGRVLGSAPLPAPATSVAATNSAVWVAAGNRLMRFQLTGRQEGALRIPGLRSVSADHVGTTVYAVDDRGSVIAQTEGGHRTSLRISADPLTGPVDGSAAVWVVAGHELWRLAEFGQ